VPPPPPMPTTEELFMAWDVLCMTFADAGSPLSVEVNMKADLREIYGAPARRGPPFSCTLQRVEFVPKLFKARGGSNFDPTRERAV
jgi:hypothetical protein